MSKIILIYGLPGSGKTTLSNKIYDIFIIQFRNDTDIQYDDGSVIARGLQIVLNFVSSNNNITWINIL